MKPEMVVCGIVAEQKKFSSDQGESMGSTGSMEEKVGAEGRKYGAMDMMQDYHQCFCAKHMKTNQ
jgi:hypothetical protein